MIRDRYEKILEQLNNNTKQVGQAGLVGLPCLLNLHVSPINMQKLNHFLNFFIGCNILNMDWVKSNFFKIIIARV